MSFNLQEVLSALVDKKELNKSMHSALNSYIENTESKIKKSHYMRAKDFVHYYGNGWSEDGDPFGENLVKDKFPDRLRPTFKNFFEAVTILKEFDMLGLAQPYLDSLSDKGLNISFHFTKDIPVDAPAKSDIIPLLDSYQSQICECADFIKDSTKAIVDETRMTKHNANLFLNKIGKLPDITDNDIDSLHSSLVSALVDKSVIEDICNGKVPTILTGEKDEN